LGAARPLPPSADIGPGGQSVGNGPWVAVVAAVSERLDVTVTYDARHGYIASAPELRQPIVALSLASLRKRIEIAMLPDEVDVRLNLDRVARREHDERQSLARTVADDRFNPDLKTCR
jgi:hypothetical protein